ncbi:hypothetical protein MMMDOFMJ_1535 [Methylobacterium gnaphalii]|nr:hypothetical protein MMMDOFMJ_1535 [Methylobacterium gnaphalii]
MGEHSTSTNREAVSIKPTQLIHICAVQRKHLKESCFEILLRDGVELSFQSISLSRNLLSRLLKLLTLKKNCGKYADER